jgi:hypothetical protein
MKILASIMVAALLAGCGDNPDAPDIKPAPEKPIVFKSMSSLSSDGYVVSETYLVTNLWTRQYAAGKPVELQSIGMTYKTSASNDLVVSYIRGGYTNVIIAATYTGYSAFWLLESPIFVDGDVVRVTCSRVGAGQLTINRR